MWTTSQNARLPVPPPKGKAIYGQVHTILATIAIGIGTIDWMCILNDYLITSKKNCLGCDSAALLIKSIQSHVGVMWRWKNIYTCVSGSTHKSKCVRGERHDEVIISC